MARQLFDLSRPTRGEVMALLVVGLLALQLVLVPTGVARAAATGDELYAAVHSGDEQAVRKLIARGADVNYVTEDGGWSCLHVAAHAGSTEIVKMLLAAGADASPQEKDGWTPLHMAVYYGHLEAVRALLDGNARTDLKMSTGATPLDLAVSTKNNAIADLIAARGGTAAGSGISLYNAASTGNLEEVKRLVGMGTEVDFKSPDGYTPMHVAAFAGHAEVVRFLLASGADPETSAGFRYTPLASAAKEGHAEVVEILAEAGASVNTLVANNVTALHIAAEGDQVEVAKVLLDHGAEPNIGSSSDPPLFYAVQHGHQDVVALLAERGAAVNPEKDWVHNTALHMATRAADLGMTTLLLKLGARPNVLNYKRETPLDLAIASGNEKLVRLLEDKGGLKGEAIPLVPEEPE